MAESILDLTVISSTAGTGVPSSTGAGASCPLIYPSDLAALLGLEGAPLPSPVPPPGGTGGGLGQQFPGLNGYLVEVDDTFRFSILVTGGPKSVVFYGSRINPDGTISAWSQTVTGNSASVSSVEYLPTGAGIVQGVGASPVGGLGSATIYVLAEVGTVQGGAFIPRLQLLSGLLTAFGVASSTTSAGGGGGGGINSNCGTLGNVFPSGSVTNWQETITVSAGTISRMMGAYWTATCSAAVANRTMTCFLNNGSDDVWFWNDPNFMVAGQVKRFNISCNLAEQQVILATGITRVTLPAPTCIFFDTDWTFTAAFNNVQGGDALSSRSLTYQVQTC